MPNISRKQFLGLGAALAGATGFAGVDAFEAPQAPQAPQALGPGADLIVLNARVFTIDPAMPRAEAFAVKDGRFIAVGSYGA